MGSPEFALPTLRALKQHYDVPAVITQPDRGAGHVLRLRVGQRPDARRHRGCVRSGAARCSPG